METIKSAIDDIVTYATLPPQIDYTLPWKIKADAAETFLLTQVHAEEAKKAFEEITRQIDSYFEPNEQGFSIAALDAMF